MIAVFFQPQPCLSIPTTGLSVTFRRLSTRYRGRVTAHVNIVLLPIGRALIGKEEGEEVEVTTPGGLRQYEILRIRYE